jgi:hypothetical protein
MCGMYAFAGVGVVVVLSLADNVVTLYCDIDPNLGVTASRYRIIFHKRAHDCGTFVPQVPMTLPPLIIFGPSGVGKGTLINRLFREFPNSVGFSVSRRVAFLASTAFLNSRSTPYRYPAYPPPSQRHHTRATPRRERWKGISLHHSRELQELDL